MRFIINADDLGRDQETNAAVFRALNDGLCSSATIMATMPGFESAAATVIDKGLQESVGLHIDLTEGRSLTEAMRLLPRFCDEDGFFKPRRKAAIFMLNGLERKVLAEEIKAQISKCRDAGLPLTHADSHNHIHEDPGMIGLFIEILKSENVPYLRLARNTGYRSSWLNKLYRHHVNGRIKGALLAGSDAFGSIHDLKYERSRGVGVELFEVMVHPGIKENRLVDVVENKSLIEIADTWSDMQMVSFGERRL